jgi:transcriptional regulator with XRE-family HTH domain
MSEPDLKTTLREFQEYLDLSYESPREFAARIGVAKETIWYWLSGRRQPKAPSLAKLRRFWMPRPSGRLGARGSGRERVPSENVKPENSGTLGFVRSVGKRGARLSLPAIFCFDASGLHLGNLARTVEILKIDPPLGFDELHQRRRELKEQLTAARTRIATPLHKNGCSCETNSGAFIRKRPV